MGGKQRPDIIDAKGTKMDPDSVPYELMKKHDMLQEGLMNIEDQMKYKYAILPEGSGGQSTRIIYMVQAKQLIFIPGKNRMLFQASLCPNPYEGGTYASCCIKPEALHYNQDA